MNFSNSPSSFRPSSANKYESRRNRLKRNYLQVNSPSSINSSIDVSTSLDKKIKIEYDNRFNLYEFSLNFYTIPPFGEISLEESQRAVEERLKVLSLLDDVKEDQAKRRDFNYNQELATRLSLLGDDLFINQVCGGKDNPKVQAARRRDHISHFLLRLLCCQNDALKKWFIQKEIELLRYRLDSEKNTLDLVKFLAYNNLNFEEIDTKEKQILMKQNKINFNLKPTVSNVFYKIPFEEALDLVRTRKVFLQDGYCYCSSVEMVSIISTKFRLELARSLASLMTHLPHLEENDRLLPIFQTIYSNLVKRRKADRMQESSQKEKIIPEMIDELSVTSFPPCMRSIHELLRLNHHLKHYGRLHYGLFLKGIGLGLEDALAFFREEFIQSMTPEKFAKEYSYNIRYNYGKEGKKVNLSAFSCAKIQNGNQPGTGDSHGCPFKHFDVNNLTKMLKRHNIDEENINEMIDLSKQQKFTSACSCYFACKNKNIRLPNDITHPNQYYNESRKIAKNLYIIPEKSGENDKENAEKNSEKSAENGASKTEAIKELDPSIFEDMNFEDSLGV